MKGRHTDPGLHLAALSLQMGLSTEAIPDLQDASDDPLILEGNPYRHLAIRYERSRKARDACIKAHGPACAVCGFDFGAVYGPDMEGFVLVHHLEMISTGRESRAIDPARDMRPVCANCHYVMHRRSPPYTVDEVKAMLRS